MAGEHEGLSNERVQRTTRRTADTWDRIKFLVLLSVIVVVAVGSKVNPPFVPLEVALSDFFLSTGGRIVAVAAVLEILRQAHYLVSERSAGYHSFWQDRLFGGFERGVQRRFKPWTRFRVGRFVRWLVIVAVYAFVIDALVGGVDSPLDAVIRAPQLALQVLPTILQFAMYLLIIVGQFGFLFWFLSRGGVDTVMPEEIKTRFADVWGQDHVLNHIRENIAFLEKPDEIEEKGGYIPGGILLWGPPGTGKTLMAEAVAGETGRPFVFVDPGAFINMFMGVGIIKVKSLYRKLRKLSLRHGGVIVFFDEADSLGSRGSGVVQAATPAPTHPVLAGCNGLAYLSTSSRSVILGAAGEQDESVPAPGGSLRDKVMMAGMGGGGMGTLQALLTEMNGLTKPRGIANRIRKLLGFRPKPPPKYRILHMMATNLPDALDPAMLRPGRIDRVYKVGYPSKDGRLVTFGGYLDKVSHALTDEHIEKLAISTPFYSGARIKDLVNEALILAVRDGRDHIEWDDIWKARTLKELGPPEDVDYIQRERHAVAIHEASHAVTAHLLGAHRRIDIVTIEKHPEFLGMVKNLSYEERFTQWKSEYEVDIMVSLASLAGERMFFHEDNSSGVSGDLSNASALGGAMEGIWGMGQGLVSYYGTTSTSSGQAAQPVSVTLARRREQVEERLQELYSRVSELLERHRDAVLALAAVLEERKTISGDEVGAVIGLPAGSELVEGEAGWHAVDDAAAEARRAQALAGLPPAVNAQRGPGANTSADSRAEE